MNLKVVIMENNKRPFIMGDIIFKNMDGRTNYLKKFPDLFDIYLRKTRFYTFLVTLSFFRSHFFSLLELITARYLWHGICQSKC